MLAKTQTGLMHVCKQTNVLPANVPRKRCLWEAYSGSLFVSVLQQRLKVWLKDFIFFSPQKNFGLTAFPLFIIIHKSLHDHDGWLKCANAPFFIPFPSGLLSTALKQQEMRGVPQTGSCRNTQPAWRLSARLPDVGSPCSGYFSTQNWENALKSTLLKVCESTWFLSFSFFKLWNFAEISPNRNLCWNQKSKPKKTKKWWRDNLENSTMSMWKPQSTLGNSMVEFQC